MREIPLTQGKVALVDDEDYNALAAYRWFAQKHVLKNGIRWYACRNVTISPGIKTIVRMHRELLPGPHPHVDHRDGDGLNNQKYNLRPASNTQNLQNTRKRLNCTSRFKGVYLDKRNGHWISRIKIYGHDTRLGVFTNEEDAARAYDIAAEQVFGEFAVPNFPELIS